MKINWDWGNPVKAKRHWFRRKPVPLCHSNHYVRDHFHPVDDPQHKLF